MSDPENPTNTDVTHVSQSPTPVGPRRTPWRTRQLVVVVVAIVVVLAVAIGGFALGKSNKSSDARISVTGSATVKGTPDTANFSIGVQTTNASAATALVFNNRQVASLERAMTKRGVTKSEMQTSTLGINENRNYRGELTGFTVNDTLDVTMHHIADVGAAIEAAAKVAGNGIQLNGISFSFSNDSALVAAARVKAMRDAHTEASEIANAGGTALGAIVKITDQENQNNVSFSGEPLGSFESSANALVPVEAGSESITVQVAVIYSLTS